MRDDTVAIRKALSLFEPPCLLPARRCTLWTTPYMVRPALVRATFGNGARLLGLTAIMHRPWYYLVRIDDQLDLDGDEWLDTLEEIWLAIGDEFGARYQEDARRYRWPEEDSSDGCAWWRAGVDDILTRRDARSLLARMRRRAVEVTP